MDKLELTIEIAAETLSTGDKVYVAHFREIELCSQGDTIEEAKNNAIEAVHLLLSCASKAELERRIPLPSKRSHTGVSRRAFLDNPNSPERPV